jgi:hypothetical protein
VTNTGSAATGGTVTVADTLPSGLTLSSMVGTGWSCGGTSCSRSDALAAASSYPSITLTVNVAGTAPASVTNAVTASGGGSASSTAYDPTTINSTGGPSLIITKSHSGNFTQGQTGATHTISVTNTGSAATSISHQADGTPTSRDLWERTYSGFLRVADENEAAKAADAARVCDGPFRGAGPGVVLGHRKGDSCDPFTQDDAGGTPASKLF